MRNELGVRAGIEGNPPITAKALVYEDLQAVEIAERGHRLRPDGWKRKRKIVLRRQLHLLCAGGST